MATPRQPTPDRKPVPQRVQATLLVPMDLPLIMPDILDDPARGERCDAAANRKRILKVAERLFTRRGVANVNMVEVAKAANVGQGTLYRRYANKAELCLGLMDEQMHGFQEHVLLHLRGMSELHASAFTKLGWFLEALAHFNEKHAPLLCESMTELDLNPRKTTPPWEWQRMTVTGLLISAMREQQVMASYEPRVMADLLLAPLHPIVFRFNRDIGGYTIDQMVQGLGQLLNGLMAAAKSPELHT